MTQELIRTERNVAADEARTARDEARARGDHALALQYDEAERRALAGELVTSPEGRVPAVTKDRVEALYQAMVDEHGSIGYRLMNDWRDRAPERVAAAVAFIEAHPRFREIAENYGLDLHPGVIALAYEAARGGGVGAGSSQGNMPGYILSGADEARRQRDIAMARGDRSLANAWDERERQELAAIENGPIVGHGGRWL